MGGAASKSKHIAGAVPKAAARPQTGGGAMPKVAPKRNAEFLGSSQGFVSVSQTNAARARMTEDGSAKESTASWMRSQTLEAEGSASRNHSSKGGGNTSSDTSDSRSSKPTPGRETGPDQDLLSRLQNLVIESEHPEVQRPPHPLKLPLKGIRKRAVGLDTKPGTVPKGFVTHRFLMMALYFHGQQAEGFRTTEEVAGLLQISVEDAEAFITYFGLYTESIEESEGALSERIEDSNYRRKLSAVIDSEPAVRPEPGQQNKPADSY